MNRVDEQSWRLRVDAVGSASRPPKAAAGREKHPVYMCDRCGSEMFELSCKVICPNCGSRFDCSDLSIYFDEQAQ